MVTAALITVFALVAVTAATALAARRLNVPDSIMLVMVGLAAGFIPDMPRVAIKPDLVLTLLLPPLLYSSGVGMSWRGFKAHIWPIMLLAVGCVLFTATAVAIVTHYILGLPWAIGFVLGAIVSPPDAVAPMAIARRFSVPERILTVLEGEGLVNDATALILFSFAVAAVDTGHFSYVAAVTKFFAIVGGELVWGAVVGWAALYLRRWARDAHVEIAISMLTPFVSFWIPEALGGSGVLATVTAGLVISWNGPRFISPATRLQGFFVWDLITSMVEGVIFLLTGLQARIVADNLNRAEWRYLLTAAVAVSLVVVIVRFFWVFPATYLPRLLPWVRARTGPLHWREPFVIGFTGIRGVVSLAAALSIPYMIDGEPFPNRGLLLLVTFSVILVTLVGQGSTFSTVVRSSGLVAVGRREAAARKRKEIEDRIAGIDDVLAKIDEMERDGADPEIIAAARRQHRDRRANFIAAAKHHDTGRTPADAARLQLELVEIERISIARLYAANKLDDGARRRIEREFDLEDSRIRHAGESGSGDLPEDLPHAED
ncbi:MAG TPA: Na+/H+ antiporter [Alphaproteobacteria bacterium]|jgi:CPA1 family monovalent cation:H+ antiporter|nr:Na+/H+ antiporter [Alphaproteobacteria bacterium]